MRLFRSSVFLCGKAVVIAELLAGVGCASTPKQAHLETPRAPGEATGVVFHDANGNGVRDSGEPGQAGVGVSNGCEVARTDRQGRYRLPVGDDTIIFVIKPAGWMTATSKHQVPHFYHVNKPTGSPPLQYAGVAPTGRLPDSVDFALYPHEEPKRFRAILLGDTQPRTQKELDYVAHDVVEELVGTDALLGVTLGDNVYNHLPLLDNLVRALGLVGMPWHYVLGNHDMNYDAVDDQHSNETWERLFGPSYYAFNYGRVHFIVLDDVIWTGASGENRGYYIGGLEDRQLEFIRNDLALVPNDRLVVLVMHIPLVLERGGKTLFREPDRDALFGLLKDHPHTLSISAHWHRQGHLFFGKKDGWPGAKPHHHLVQGTVCGSWWSGAPDERGIPHATMSDGTPNGYSTITFDGADYAIEYRAAGRPADHQMAIFVPEEVAGSDAAKTEVLVNVFAGSERSTVEMQLGDTGPWVVLKRVQREDPFYLRMKEAEESPTPPRGRRLPTATSCTHLWQAYLPPNPIAGTHLLRVRTTDMFGQTYSAVRVVRIR
ncbi:MAG: metallophosphoesterase [bacterium]|nr:metallophosphoesterase [bacterium]